MRTVILSPDEGNIRIAAEAIKSGKLVAFPTETVYGLGANALDEHAVMKIFLAKGRPQDNPLIVHIADPDEAQRYYEDSEQARKLAKVFWPGPLTIIRPAKDTVPLVTRGGLASVAVRCPEAEIARSLIANAGVPIAAPSANISGRPSPTTAEEVKHDMTGRVPYIIDGGHCRIGVESTVVSLLQDRVRILRPGGVTKEMLESVVPCVEVDTGVLNAIHSDKPLSPGMKYRHYAPSGAMTIVTGEYEEQIAAMCELYDRAMLKGLAPVIIAPEGMDTALDGRQCYALGETLDDMASGLYSSLLRADEDGYNYIISPEVGYRDMGMAIMNRLLRAAAFNLVKAKDVLNGREDFRL